MNFAPDPVLALLTERLAPGVWATDARAASVGPLARSLGWTTIELALTPTSDKATILTDLADAADFPSHFGSNWDAAADCLKDLPLSGHRWLVIISAAGVDGSAPPFAVLLDILQEASAFWAGQGRHLSSLWVGDPTPAALALSDL